MTGYLDSLETCPNCGNIMEEEELGHEECDNCSAFE